MAEPDSSPSRALGPMPWAIAQTDCWPGTAKVMEECGELVQVLAKLIALGSDGIHWDGSDLRERIEEEVGDVLGAITFFLENNPSLRGSIIGARADQKHLTFTGWHNERIAHNEHSSMPEATP